MTGMRWLRLPEGVSAEDCNDRSADGVHGELARGIAVQAEPVPDRREQPGRQQAEAWQRFRCRSCSVLTHAVRKTGRGRVHTALVCSYERSRCRAALRDEEQAEGDRDDIAAAEGLMVLPPDEDGPTPPGWGLRFQEARLEDIMLPRAQARAQERL